ncbi:melatonin receptor type 1C-like [Montipora foliosa]|uniref:melatonin receptor type 1C-like n=1 Tax=Montipora foliosa TaxID=591990 RepID=UPI0035F21308
MKSFQNSEATLYSFNQTAPGCVQPIRSPAELYVSLSSYAFLAIANVIGNGLVIGAYVSDKWLQRAIRHTFIIGLAIADFFIGVFPLPIWMYITYSDYHDSPLNWTLYQVYITADIFIGSTSILQLTAGLASIQPLQYGTQKQRTYTVFLAIVCFFIPTTVITTAYLSIFIAIKTKKAMTRYRKSRNTLAKEVRLSFTVAIIALVFVITWLPLFSVTMLATFNPGILPSSPKSERVLNFVKWMHYCSSALTPFLYAYRHKELQRTMLLLLQRLFVRRNQGGDRKEVRSFRSGSMSFINARKLSSTLHTRSTKSTEMQSTAESCSRAISSGMRVEISGKGKETKKKTSASSV